MYMKRDIGHGMEAIRRWSFETVQACCVAHQYYTRGDCEDYGKMLDMADDLPPTYENIYDVAQDIYRHSRLPEDYSLETLMYVLEAEAVHTTFGMNPER